MTLAQATTGAFRAPRARTGDSAAAFALDDQTAITFLADPSAFAMSRDWTRSARLRLQEIASLGPDWEPGAEPVYEEALIQAWLLALNLVRLELPEPMIVPTGEGTIEFEWNAPGTQLNLEVTGQEMLFMVRDPESGDVAEGELAESRSAVLDAFMRLRQLT